MAGADGPLANSGDALPAPVSRPNRARRRWPLVLYGMYFCLYCAIGLAYVLEWPGEYTASTLVSVYTGNHRGPYFSADQVPDFSANLRTQLALMRSHRVLSAALQDPRVTELPIIKKQSNPMEWLEQCLQVETVGGSEIARISLSGDDPNEVAAIVTAVTDAYLNASVTEEQAENLAKLKKKWIHLFEEQNDRYARFLEKQRETGIQLALKQLQARQGENEMPTTAPNLFALPEDISEIAKALQRLEREIALLEREARPNTLLEPIAVVWKRTW
jgi:uncharacterized protein involved in exopolysaccharide biosynthesis